MKIVCFDLDLQNYVKLTSRETMTFWYGSKWTLKGWNSSIMGEAPELFYYKGRRLYPAGNKEWLPLGVA